MEWTMAEEEDAALRQLIQEEKSSLCPDTDSLRDHIRTHGAPVSSRVQSQALSMLLGVSDKENEQRHGVSDLAKEILGSCEYQELVKEVDHVLRVMEQECGMELSVSSGEEQSTSDWSEFTGPRALVLDTSLDVLVNLGAVPLSFTRQAKEIEKTTRHLVCIVLHVSKAIWCVALRDIPGSMGLEKTREWVEEVTAGLCKRFAVAERLDVYEKPEADDAFTLEPAPSAFVRRTLSWVAPSVVHELDTRYPDWYLLSGTTGDSDRSISLMDFLFSCGSTHLRPSLTISMWLTLLCRKSDFLSTDLSRTFLGKACDLLEHQVDSGGLSSMPVLKSRGSVASTLPPQTYYAVLLVVLLTESNEMGSISGASSQFHGILCKVADNIENSLRFRSIARPSRTDSCAKGGGLSALLENEVFNIVKSLPMSLRASSHLLFCLETSSDTRTENTRNINSAAQSLLAAFDESCTRDLPIHIPRQYRLLMCSLLSDVGLHVSKTSWEIAMSQLLRVLPTWQSFVSSFHRFFHSWGNEHCGFELVKDTVRLLCRPKSQTAENRGLGGASSVTPSFNLHAGLCDPLLQYWPSLQPVEVLKDLFHPCVVSQRSTTEFRQYENTANIAQNALNQISTSVAEDMGIQYILLDIRSPKSKETARFPFALEIDGDRCLNPLSEQVDQAGGSDVANRTTNTKATSAFCISDLDSDEEKDDALDMDLSSCSYNGESSVREIVHAIRGIQSQQSENGRKRVGVAVLAEFTSFSPCASDIRSWIVDGLSEVLSVWELMRIMRQEGIYNVGVIEGGLSSLLGTISLVYSPVYSQTRRISSGELTCQRRMCCVSVDMLPAGVPHVSNQCDVRAWIHDGVVLARRGGAFCGKVQDYLKRIRQSWGRLRQLPLSRTKEEIPSESSHFTKRVTSGMHSADDIAAFCGLCLLLYTFEEPNDGIKEKLFKQGLELNNGVTRFGTALIEDTLREEDSQRRSFDALRHSSAKAQKSFSKWRSTASRVISASVAKIKDVSHENPEVSSTGITSSHGHLRGSWRAGSALPPSDSVSASQGRLRVTLRQGAFLTQLNASPGTSIFGDVNQNQKLVLKDYFKCIQNKHSLSRIEVCAFLAQDCSSPSMAPIWILMSADVLLVMEDPGLADEQWKKAVSKFLSTESKVELRIPLSSLRELLFKKHSSSILTLTYMSENGQESGLTLQLKNCRLFYEEISNRVQCGEGN
eukprot:gb/GECG01008416.1/.p1 GENE.gb/GECG01008416.1/~~gb/GECG01008416.1/.p1  ORF type:complete len:1213 (+),score=116.62 gb/GECG01008416.1/:1-3639(+)